MAYKKIFLDENYFYELDTAGAETNLIVTSAMDFIHPQTGAVIGNTIKASLQGVEYQQVAHADVDDALNIGRFATYTDGRLYFIVDKTAVDTNEKAINYLRGILVRYELRTLEYNQTLPNLYTIETRTSDGIVVSNTVPTDLSDLVSRIETLDATLNVNTVGYYIHSIIRSLTVPS